MSFQSVLGSKVYVPLGGVYETTEIVSTAGAEDRFNREIPRGIFGGQVVGAFRQHEEGGESREVVLQLLNRDPAWSVLVWMIEFLLVMVTLRVAILVAKRFWFVASNLVDLVLGQDTLSGSAKHCWICGHRDETLNIDNTSTGTEENLMDTSGSITSISGRTGWSRTESATRERDSIRSSGETSRHYPDSELEETDTDYCINKWMNSEPQPVQGPRRQVYLRKLAKSLLAIAKYIEKRDEVFHLCLSEAPWAEKLNKTSTNTEAPCCSESKSQPNNGVEKLQSKEPTGGLIKMGFWRVAADMEFPSGLKYEPQLPTVVDKRASSEDCSSLSFLECAVKAGLYTPGENGKQGALRPCHTEWDKRIRSNQLKRLFQARSKHRDGIRVGVAESEPAIKFRRSQPIHEKNTGGGKVPHHRQETKGNRRRRTISVNELENALKRVEAKRLYFENSFAVSGNQNATSFERTGEVGQVYNRLEARTHSASAVSEGQHKSENLVLQQGASTPKDDSNNKLINDLDTDESCNGLDKKLISDPSSDLYRNLWQNLNSSLSNSLNDGLGNNENSSDLVSERSYDSSVQAYVLDKFFSSKQLWDERCERRDEDGYLSELSGYLSENGSGRSVILERFLELNRKQLVTVVTDSPANPPDRKMQFENLETSYASNLLNSCVGDWTLTT